MVGYKFSLPAIRLTNGMWQDLNGASEVKPLLLKVMEIDLCEWKFYQGLLNGKRKK